MPTKLNRAERRQKAKVRLISLARSWLSKKMKTLSRLAKVFTYLLNQQPAQANNTEGERSEANNNIADNGQPRPQKLTILQFGARGKR